MIIYKITDLVNNKIYIGQTIQSIEKRWKAHNKLNNNSYIACSIRKYGKENFTIEQIDSSETLEELNIGYRLISNILRGLGKSTKGFTFKYDNKKEVQIEC